MSQVIVDMDKRIAKFARVRALILQLVNAEPGLTYTEIGNRLQFIYGFRPRIGNRIRELRRIGYVETKLAADGLLHVYPTKEQGGIK